MFKRLLIANRGEIACRVMATARRLGIETVAVYSDADRSAKHVRKADRAVRLGPAPAHESYLNSDVLLNLAQEMDVDAIHPGYGFLSENADFAEGVARAGMVFVGPPASAIHSMGSKSSAKAIMIDAGVPVVPGYHGDDGSAERLASEAAAMGYPVLLKAVAGGGGKGMRVVEGPDDFSDALAAASREARAAFGDDRFLVEKFLAHPRHVEVQVFADQKGHAVHLYERDCSLQRRHQKIVEEAPAPGLSEDLRRAMGVTACRAAEAISYQGAGTVEFLLDENGSFYFMEMNTRLQVEHPVTEMVTGLDLVEWQLRIAAGEDLPLTQDEIKLNGHAVEARLYAEEPEAGFLPTGGLFHRFRWQDHSEDEGSQFRLDSGVEEGDEASIHYDPMVAKAISWAPDRSRAIDGLKHALDQAEISGVATNRRFLAEVLGDPDFTRANLHTSLVDAFVDRWQPTARLPDSSEVILAALGVYLTRAQQAFTAGEKSPEANSPWHEIDGWRLNDTGGHTVVFYLPEKTFSLTLQRGERNVVWVLLGNDAPPVPVRQAELTDGRIHALLDGESHSCGVDVGPAAVELYVRGDTLSFPLSQSIAARDGGQTSDGDLTSPMPGKIVAVHVDVGQKVQAGETVVIVEAMKMEHAVKAPSAGIVTSVHVVSGQQVTRGELLVTLDLAGTDC